MFLQILIVSFADKSADVNVTAPRHVSEVAWRCCSREGLFSFAALLFHLLCLSCDRHFVVTYAWATDAGLQKAPPTSWNLHEQSGQTFDLLCTACKLVETKGSCSIGFPAKSQFMMQTNQRSIILDSSEPFDFVEICLKTEVLFKTGRKLGFGFHKSLVFGGQ